MEYLRHLRPLVLDLRAHSQPPFFFRGPITFVLDHSDREAVSFRAQCLKQGTTEKGGT